MEMVCRPSGSPRLKHGFEFEILTALSRAFDSVLLYVDVEVLLYVHDDDELMLNVLRHQLTYYGQVVTNAEARFNKSLRPWKPEGSLGRTAQDVHLDSLTAPKLCFTSTETVGLLGTGAQDVHLDFHTAPELCFTST